MPKRLFSSAKNTYRDREQLIDKIRKCAQNFIKDSPPVKKIILPGSLATDNYSIYNDADLLIILKESQFSRFFDRIPEFLTYFTDSGIPVDLFPYAEEEINRMRTNNKLIKRALAEGITLGANLND